MRVTTAAEFLGGDIEDLPFPFLAWNAFGSGPGPSHPPTLQWNYNCGKLLDNQFVEGVAVIEALGHSLQRSDSLRIAVLPARQRHRVGHPRGARKERRPGWQPTPVDWSERQTAALAGAGLTSETA